MAYAFVSTDSLASLPSDEHITEMCFVVKVAGVTIPSVGDMTGFAAWPATARR
jgi:hypothetical protein